MAIEIILEGNLKPHSNQEKFTHFLEHFCHHKHLKFEDYGEMVSIDICPEGSIECTYENDFVSILAQTNVAGPGFHAFVADIMNEIMIESEVSLESHDPTGYMEDHDFESLKYEYFYKWLASIQDYVNENEELENLCISWPTNYYRPQPKKGYVVTPMGYISMDDFTNLEVEELAELFFLWNESGMHAKYYLNCALNLIWKECFFEYSAMNEYTWKIADSIMDYLELAHELDATLELPVTIYHSLSQIVHREDLLTIAQPLADEHMGYRKHVIQYEIGNWIIPIDGFSEIYQDLEKGSAQIINCYHSEEEVWKWMLQIDVKSIEELDSIFLEDSQFIMDKSTIEKDLFSGKSVTLNYGDHFEIYAQLIGDQDELIIRYRTVEERYLSNGKTMIENIQRYQINEADSIKH